LIQKAKDVNLGGRSRVRIETHWMPRNPYVKFRHNGGVFLSEHIVSLSSKSHRGSGRLTHRSANVNREVRHGISPPCFTKTSLSLVSRRPGLAAKDSSVAARRGSELDDHLDAVTCAKRLDQDLDEATALKGYVPGAVIRPSATKLCRQERKHGSVVAGS